mmetsp:Transcript_10736/g.20236  ORF Transcript_10736/g.20236 Transcript_10736/m.20236 type:complete len:266 (+) Transcript_10736:1109-1906(+)
MFRPMKQLVITNGKPRLSNSHLPSRVHVTLYAVVQPCRIRDLGMCLHVACTSHPLASTFGLFQFPSPSCSELTGGAAPQLQGLYDARAPPSRGGSGRRQHHREVRRLHNRRHLHHDRHSHHHLHSHRRRLHSHRRQRRDRRLRILGLHHNPRHSRHLPHHSHHRHRTHGHRHLHSPRPRRNRLRRRHHRRHRVRTGNCRVCIDPSGSHGMYYGLHHHLHGNHRHHHHSRLDHHHSHHLHSCHHHLRSHRHHRTRHRRRHHGDWAC